MKQALALEIMLSGENVFLTGAAGSGKTFVLNQFIKLSKRAGKKVSVTATTGLAATHLGGTTIHSWSGMGIMDFLPAKFVENLSKGRREIIENTDTLIIDEISMLHDFRLDIIDEICRLVRKNDTPFGGIQVILCGDFFWNFSILMLVKIVYIMWIGLRLLQYLRYCYCTVLRNICCRILCFSQIGTVEYFLNHFPDSVFLYLSWFQDFLF